jgi:putative addiction module component (TIGR02574 family)
MDAQFASLLKLDRAERLQLVGDLWDSLAEEEPLQLSAERSEELLRRKAKFEADPGSGLTWDQVKERVRARHGR